MASFTNSGLGSQSSNPEETEAMAAAANSSAPVRHKRKQVSRACDRCRVNRIKCDTGYPCSNCKVNGKQCTTKGISDVRTLPQALREIEKFKNRVKELEEQLEQKEVAIKTPGSYRTPRPPVLTPESSHDSVVDEATAGITVSTECLSLEQHEAAQAQKRPWVGIWARSARSEQVSYYGPASSYYFLHRMSSYLCNALQQPHAEDHFQPNSAAKAFTTPDDPDTVGDEELDTPLRVVNDRRAPSLTRQQEEYFLSLYWSFYGCIMPIVEEGQFREYYKSLWDTSPGPYRRQSALVDIMLALCMQYGFAFIPRESSKKAWGTDSSVDSDDATLAGRCFYRRCQSLLSSDMESPSIMTVQCHIFSLVYLCCASFQNMAHTTLALAIKTAQILGLHLEPPDTMPHEKRELCKRIWAFASRMEINTAVKLGRPIGFSVVDVNCATPADDFELAASTGTTLPSYGKQITYLSYLSHTSRLTCATRDIYEAVYNRYDLELARYGVDAPYDDPACLEACAAYLSTRIGYIQANFFVHVPEDLKMRRRNGGEPFSTDRTPMDIDHTVPIWLLRQRICLETVYHSQIMNLYRPFINFAAQSIIATGGYAATPTAEAHAAVCVAHAIAHTNIIHQVLSETDLLNGWHESFQWQWNATVTLIGFLLAYPISPSAPTVRRTIDRAIEAFEIFGSNNVAVSRSAAAVTRNLVAKADLLIARFRTGLSRPLFPQTTPPKGTPSPGSTELQPGADIGGALGWVHIPEEFEVSGGSGRGASASSAGHRGSAASQGQDGAAAGPAAGPAADLGAGDLPDFMDFAFAVDNFHSFEGFFVGNGIGEPSNLIGPGQGVI